MFKYHEETETHKKGEIFILEFWNSSGLQKGQSSLKGILHCGKENILPLYNHDF